MDRLGQLDPKSLEAARDFIRRWNELKSGDWGWIPEEKLWVNFVANNQEQAALFE